ncbi:uncharacterized protein [Pyrus communis]|uniref:uncharacterized protein n=1 Tax=Pyrus communis TaxID=23211 RepID=UPI0035BEE438
MDPNQQGNSNMEGAKRFLGLTPVETEAVSRLAVPEWAAGARKCFYDAFAVAGIRVDRVEPGLVVCSFKVPPRLTDRSGKLANGAIANLVDLVGISLEFGEGLGSVSTDISISYLSAAKIGDELEITSKRLGRRGGYTGIVIVLRNKTTGEITAEGRHSLLRSSRASKL